MLAALLILVAMILAGYAAASMLGTRQEARQALERRISVVTGIGDGASRVGVLKDRRLSAISALNTFLPRLSLVTPLAKTIARAGLNKRVGEVLLSVALAAVAGFLVVTMATDSPAIGVLAAAVGAGLPLLAIKRKARRRAAVFAEQLPDALDLVRAALQAGHGLMAAMSVVADEFPDPIAQEFRDVTEEVRLGRTVREAFARLAERVDNPDLALLEVGILTAQDIGGNLAEVLDKISYTIRERFKIERELNVLTAQGRLSGGVLTALPLLVATVLVFVAPDYFLPILHSKTGWYLLAYAAVSLILGNLIIRRVVRIEV